LMHEHRFSHPRSAVALWVYNASARRSARVDSHCSGPNRSTRITLWPFVGATSGVLQAARQRCCSEVRAVRSVGSTGPEVMRNGQFIKVYYQCATQLRPQERIRMISQAATDVWRGRGPLLKDRCESSCYWLDFLRGRKALAEPLSHDGSVADGTMLLLHRVARPATHPGEHRCFICPCPCCSRSGALSAGGGVCGWRPAAVER
jgi:hypothetical protein